MKSLRNITLAVFGLLCLASSSFASYTVLPAKSEPQMLRWKDRTIRIALSRSFSNEVPNIKRESDISGAILRSLALWERAANLKFVVEFSDLTSLSPSGVAGDGVSLITIAASPENVLLFSRNPFSESAKTRVFYDRSGYITEADIVLNPYQQFSTDGTFGSFDLEATLTHEIGHLLGLRHSIVLGSAMSAGLARNGVAMGVDQFVHVLSDSDVSAVRELYDEDDVQDECCAVISGKLSQPGTKALPALRVWAEVSKTGNVAAQTESAPDGSFRLGGLPDGIYSVFWQHLSKDDVSTVGELGTHRIAKGESKSLSEKISLVPVDATLSYVGLNDQLSESPISVGTGREYIVYLGGKNLDPTRVAVEFNSPFFRALPGSIRKYDFGEGVSAISFVLSVDSDVSPGVYSVFLTDKSGILGALVGGVKVQPSAL
ncbi:MAG: matrixin family metalloprotease [Pyrinomonadaceae bacterium]